MRSVAAFKKAAGKKKRRSRQLNARLQRYRRQLRSVPRRQADARSRKASGFSTQAHRIRLGCLDARLMPARERPPGSVRRRIEFDAETWHAVHKLSLDSMKSLQELADEAFR